MRLNCKNCKQPHEPLEGEIQAAGFTEGQLATATFIKGRGCGKCQKRGYKGRMGIFEIMLLDDNLRSVLLKTYDANQIKKEALNQNMVTLLEDGRQKVLKGMTTIEEVLRVTQK